MSWLYKYENSVTWVISIQYNSLFSFNNLFYFPISFILDFQWQIKADCSDFNFTKHIVKDHFQKKVHPPTATLVIYVTDFSNLIFINRFLFNDYMKLIWWRYSDKKKVLKHSEKMSVECTDGQTNTSSNVLCQNNTHKAQLWLWLKIFFQRSTIV